MDECSRVGKVLEEKKSVILSIPEISRFYGIVVYMFFNDHNPPHFKIKYAEFEANILIENGKKCPIECLELIVCPIFSALSTQQQAKVFLKTPKKVLRNYKN